MRIPARMVAIAAPAAVALAGPPPAMRRRFGGERWGMPWSAGSSQRRGGCGGAEEPGDQGKGAHKSEHSITPWSAASLILRGFLGVARILRTTHIGSAPRARNCGAFARGDGERNRRLPSWERPLRGAERGSGGGAGGNMQLLSDIWYLALQRR